MATVYTGAGTTAGIFSGLNNVDIYNTGTSNGTGLSAWPSWIETAATGATTNVWITWTAGGTTNVYQPTTAYQPTAADLAAREARETAQRVEMARRQDVDARAEALLRSLLTPAQRAQFDRDRHFDVIARGSQRRYRLHYGSHGNVKLLDPAGREVVSYCGQPGGVPVADILVAQKLQIEADEAAWLKAANARRIAA